MKCSVSLEEATYLMASTKDPVLLAACNTIVNLHQANLTLTEELDRSEKANTELRHALSGLCDRLEASGSALLQRDGGRKA